MTRNHSTGGSFHHPGTVLVLLAILATGSQAALYEGSLSSSNGGLSAFGDWATGTSTLRWAIDYTSGSWHYAYTLGVPGEHAISHMIVEVSSTFGDSNLQSPSWNDYEITTFSAANGNPGMPGSVHGVKFDDTASSGTTLTVSFDSDRAPVWGDFYAKNGTEGGTDIYLYNSGFSAADPLVPAAGGSVQNHLLVPDTTTVVPAPGAVLLGSLGLSLAGYLLKRKEQMA